MTDMMAEFLGPFVHPVVWASLAIVIVKRQAIRKRHIVWLVAITGLGIVAFFALLLLLLAWRGGGGVFEILFMGLLRLIAATVIACGSVVGFSFMLKMLGLAPLED